MRGAGCDDDEAGTVARRLVDSNLVGHESHGVLRVSQVPRVDARRHAAAQHGADDRLRERHDRDHRRPPRLRPGDRRIRRGARHREGTREGHRDDRPHAIADTWAASATGRTWRRRRARCRCTSSTRPARSASRRTAAATGACRPIRSRSACRSQARDPVVLDVTTSTVAEGKLMVALNKGEQVPEGWIIDKERRADDRPEGFLRRRRAAHRRRAQGLGPVDGHRPAGGRGVDRSELRPRRPILRNNMLSIYIAPDVYDPDGGVAREARRFVDFVKASPPAKPGEPVLAPGDVERRNRAARLADGVSLDDKTWADLVAAAASVGIDASRAAAIVGAEDRRAELRLIRRHRTAQERQPTSVLFPGFPTRRIATSGAEIHCVVGGSGPPLLLLHGYPQTHAMWHRVAPALAARFTVVCSDLRGYGDSSKPDGGVGHVGYSKRAMAADQVEADARAGLRALPARRPRSRRPRRASPVPRSSAGGRARRGARHLADADHVRRHRTWRSRPRTTTGSS